MSSEEEMNIKSKYNLRNDLLIVTISKGDNKGKEILLNDNFNLIFSNEGIPLFLEIYNASSVFSANKFSLTRVSDIDIIIKVEKDFINLESKFAIAIHNKNEIFNFDFKVENTENIPSQ
ncbi:MAG: hypothetical protein KO202_03550 [Methanobacteriaceae archaeon]|jgi:hypothetical protein|nr:hypothetical protein [Methanobacteriaceae archaeon]